MLADTDFEVRVFASPVSYGGLYPHQPWRYLTYTVDQPFGLDATERAKWILPVLPWWLPPFGQWAKQRFQLATRWLTRLIETWRPDIIHTLRLNPEAGLTWQALQCIPTSRRPKWVLSSWGSELYIETDDPAIRQQISLALRHCDGFISDCRRDLRLALEAGLDESKVALREPVPVTGGINLHQFADAQKGSEKRRLIVVPKAYEGPYHKGLPILEALRIVEPELSDYEIHLLMCSQELRRWLRRMPESLQQRCVCHDHLLHGEVMDLLKRARVMIGTSLSDGTPNVMLEAMAAGALPLLSPLESICEWINDGQNGLLAHALYPTEIAAALRRALTDDGLFETARSINWSLVSARANREVIKPQVLNYYRSLISLPEPARLPV